MGEAAVGALCEGPLMPENMSVEHVRSRRNVIEWLLPLLAKQVTRCRDSSQSARVTLDLPQDTHVRPLVQSLSSTSKARPLQLAALPCDSVACAGQHMLLLYALAPALV
jgi:hypothetical protein